MIDPILLSLIDSVTLISNAFHLQWIGQHNCVFICHLPSIEAGWTQELSTKLSRVRRAPVFMVWIYFPEHMVYLRRQRMINQVSPVFLWKTQSGSLVTVGHRERWVGCMISSFAGYLSLGCPLPQHQHGRWRVHNHFITLIKAELFILQLDLPNHVSLWFPCE